MPRSRSRRLPPNPFSLFAAPRGPASVIAPSASPFSISASTSAPAPPQPNSLSLFDRITRAEGDNRPLVTQAMSGVEGEEEVVEEEEEEEEEKGLEFIDVLPVDDPDGLFGQGTAPVSDSRAVFGFGTDSETSDEEGGEEVHYGGNNGNEEEEEEKDKVAVYGAEEDEEDDALTTPPSSPPQAPYDTGLLPPDDSIPASPPSSPSNPNGLFGPVLEPEGGDVHGVFGFAEVKPVTGRVPPAKLVRELVAEPDEMLDGDHTKPELAELESELERELERELEQSLTKLEEDRAKAFAEWCDGFPDYLNDLGEVIMEAICQRQAQRVEEGEMDWWLDSELSGYHKNNPPQLDEDTCKFQKIERFYDNTDVEKGVSRESGLSAIFRRVEFVLSASRTEHYPNSELSESFIHHRNFSHPVSHISNSSSSTMQDLRQDPSSGIQPQLLPHVHLVSTYRFPLLPTLHAEKVAEWLLGAPKITRDQAPFYWTYLDRPQEGTILLVWQAPALGNEFPSDGFVWAPQETAFQLEVNGGYTLEMYAHKSGYAPGEPVAHHSRRRYRLLPSKFPNNNSPAPNPSLWIVHYGQSEAHERIPSNLIPLDMRVQSAMNTRNYLQSQGQIVQKEFMLGDPSNYPQIQFPSRAPQNRGPPMYGGHAPQARVPQSMAYPTQHTSAGPPAKRPRTHTTAGQNAAAGGHAVLDVDDDEDTSRGDLFDHFTPREISLNRYKQNHEWMEEILSSPYSINQIIPADLGLGVRGELANLTEGFFDAPFDPEKDEIEAKHNYVGRLDPEKAAEFRTRANERISETNKEIEKMKAKHAKRMAKFQRGSLITHAEKELRAAVANPSDIGPEYWRLEGKIDEDENGDTVIARVPSKVDNILAQVEASLGRHAVAVQELRRIQDGGYEEAAPLPPTPPANISSPEKSVPQSSLQSDLHSAPRSMNGTPQSGVLVGDSDMDMGNSAAGMLDQYRTGLSSDATPGSNFATPQATTLRQHSPTGTPSKLNISSPVPQVQRKEENAPADVTMGEASDQVVAADGTGTGDWVVIPPGGISPIPDANQSLEAPQTTAAATSERSPPPIMTSTSTPQAPMTSASTPLPAMPSTTDNTPLPDFGTSPNDFADLGDLDTAGDALASYGEMETGGDELGDLGDLGDMDVGMDDSAFGEAFDIGPRASDLGDEGTGDGM